MMRWIGLLATLLLCASLAQADGERQRAVAERGARVMPFDLEATMHRFEPLEDGGVQRVIVKDSGDRAQVELIRSHLQEEAEQFQLGDFGDPAAIHGEHMPGLAELARGAARIRIDYRPLREGGEIRYRTEDPELVAAIHRWFRAQLHDHGRHAEHDH